MICEVCHEQEGKPRRSSPYDLEQDRTVLCQDCWLDVLGTFKEPLKP